jgi:hypothetical protein
MILGLPNGNAPSLIPVDVRRGYRLSNFADWLFSRLLNPEATPSIRANIAIDYQTGTGCDKVHAVTALLIAFRFILIFCLGFIHLAGFSKAETR